MRYPPAGYESAGAAIHANYAYAYNDGDNMTSKTEPWSDDFSDGTVADDGLTASGTWSVSNGAAQNASSVNSSTLYRTLNDDDIEFRFAYSIDSYSTGAGLVTGSFRYNTTAAQRLMVRFKPGQAELLYIDGSTSTVYTNTGATSATGTKYNVRVEADGSHLRVWRALASGGVETLVFDRTDAPTYNGDRLMLGVLINTLASYDDVLVLAGDSGLSRTTSLYYRTNNEIDYTTDYNGTTNYTFDAWGRTNTEAKNGVTKTYSWTSANLLAGIDSSASGDVDVTYNYTGDLKRNWRLENGTLTNAYAYDAGFNVLDEGSSVYPQKTYVPGLAEVSGSNLASSADYHYITTDHLGSTRGMWNGSLTQTGNWEFTPYGSRYNFAGPGDVTQLFTRHDLDKVTGQYYAPFRYLNTGIGRWDNADPLGMINGTNMYGYAGGSPTMFMDPLGLNWVDNVQLGLDGFGLIPVIGEVADGTNGVISLLRGNYLDAGLGFAAMVPILGDGATACKVGRKAVNAVEGTAAAAKTVARVEEGAAAAIKASEATRISNAANRIGKPIHLVGSRAEGTARAASDWDYIIPGINNRDWRKIKNSLPGSGYDGVGVDRLGGPLNSNLPHITFDP